jgi:hypothetical protein
MNIIPLTIKIGVEDDKGARSLQDQDIQLVLDNVFFLHKPPLETFKQISCLTPQPIITEADIPEEALLAAGLVRFETPERTYAWINPRHVMFYFNPDLGVYVLAFPGGSRVGIITTGVDLAKVLEVSV